MRLFTVSCRLRTRDCNARLVLSFVKLLGHCTAVPLQHSHHQPRPAHLHQPALHSPTKNCQIIHHPSGKWTINVDNVSSLDAESDEVPKPAFFELETVKRFAVCLESEIGAIDRGHTVIPFISVFSVLPNDLLRHEFGGKIC